MSVTVATFAPLIALGLVAFVIWLLAPLCVAVDHVDHPGGHKRHARIVPLCGGLAMVAGLLIVSSIDGHASLGLLLGVTALCGMGALDDRMHLPPWLRLGGQALAVLVAMIAIGGVRLESLGALTGGHVIHLGPAATVFTVFAVVGVINAVNMIDGLDGLAGSFAALTLVVFVAVSASADVSTALPLIALGCVAGFLLFNLPIPRRPRATVFMGDAGSLPLGFLLTWYAVSLSQGTGAPLAPIAMVWIFGLPLFDTGYVMLSRALKGKNPMHADNHHLHHLLGVYGFASSRILLIWLALAALLMGIGVLGPSLGLSEAVLCFGFVAAFLVYFTSVSLLWRHAEDVLRTPPAADSQP